MAHIAVFDSGVGGLSVLKALRAEMPEGQFVYLADSGYAPYGERGEQWVALRCQELAQWLQQQHKLDALVVACNTATAAAIDRLRQLHPGLPIVGVEPGLKPAQSITGTGHVGVMATRGTLQSQRFANLLDKVNSTNDAGLPNTQWHLRPCDGLADAIERNDTAAIERLCQSHGQALLEQAQQLGGHIDVVVLGCTHYPFASETMRSVFGPQVALIDTGAAVARHTRTRLGLPPPEPTAVPSTPVLLTTGLPDSLDLAAHRWLGTPRHTATKADIPNLLKVGDAMGLLGPT